MKINEVGGGIFSGANFESKQPRAHKGYEYQWLLPNGTTFKKLLPEVY